MTLRQDAPSRLAIRLLGPLDVTNDGTSVTLGGRQSRAVFILLALSARTAISTERLIDQLWDDEPPGGAVNTMQVYVSRLRRILGAGSGSDAGAAPAVLRSTSQGYLLDVPREAIDLHRFEQAAATGQAALAAGDPQSAARELRAALGLWRGPALTDLTSTIGEVHRARLEGLRLSALAARLDADAALGQDAAIVPELQELVRRHPLDERFTGQLMTALYRSGRQADALAAYAAAQRRLGEELGVDPSPALQDRYAEVLRHATSLSPAPIGQGSAGPPVPRTGLIGREPELRVVRELVDGDARLITLAGPGGIGKTRLATELARELAGGPEAGATGMRTVLVGLDGVRGGEELLTMIGRALGRAPGWVSGWGGEQLTEAVSAELDEQPTLLVLDEVEQAGEFTATAAAVGELLNRTRSLIVLATSRAALHLRGEHLVTVPPLPPADAVRLFRDRAAEVLPGFEVSSVNADEVSAVCALLDGLPLAIELAAARIRTLPPEEMLRRLRPGRQLELLRGGPSDLPERQRSMRALLDSSVAQLSPDQARLLADLSVFSGGWTLAAMEAVCDGGNLDELDRLVDHSLVLADGSGRFSMLATIREYAAGLLAARPPEQRRVVLDRHARYFAELAHRPADEPGRNPDSPVRLELEAESANLTAALQHAAGSRDGSLLVSLVLSLLGHWFYTGRLGQADHWVEAAKEAATSEHERAQLLLVAGNLALVGADLSRAVPALTQAHQAARGVGEGELTARTLAARSVAARYSGHHQQALALVEQALQTAREAGAWALVVRLGNERGELLDETGHPDAAESLFESFRAWSQVEQAASNLAVALVNLAAVAAGQNDVERAADLLAEAAAAAGTGQSVPLRADVLAGTGLVQLRLGCPDAAGTALRAAIPLMLQAGQLITLPDTISLLGAVALAEGDRRSAVRLLATGQAWRDGRGLAVVGRLTREVLTGTARELERTGPGEHDAADREAAAALPFAALAGLGSPLSWGTAWLQGAPTVERPSFLRQRFVPHSGHSVHIPEPAARPEFPEKTRITLPEDEELAADSTP